MSSETTSAERDAVHGVELGAEHLYRAYGHLLAFHHEVGRAMDRLADAEGALREVERAPLADELRDTHLPQGVVGDRWSYELVEAYRDGLLADVTDFEDRVRRRVAGGRGHVAEREQERRWRERARR